MGKLEKADVQQADVKARGEIYPPYLLCKTLSSSVLRVFVLCFVAVLAATAASTQASAQQVSVKTNVLYDATATINLGAEMRVAPRWSVDLSGNLNAWNMGKDRRWKHWLLQPEARYWLCEATTGHFFALHGLGGKYNVGKVGFAHDLFGVHFSNLKDNRYQGWFVGAGVGYGYSFTLTPHWSVEAEIAVGWIHAHYERFECEGCGRRVGEGNKDFVAPTKLAVNLVYVF